MADYSGLINDLNRVINYERILRTAATTCHNLMVQRIFTDGKNKDGANIGVYDKSPIYVNPNRSPRHFTPKGKDSKQAKKITKTYKKRLKGFGYSKQESSQILARKTKYFASGYFEFRAAAGRQNSKVDLTLTGTLRSSFVVAASGTSFVSKFLNETQAEIAEGNEDRFDSVIFELTQAEENAFVRIMEDAVNVD